MKLVDEKCQINQTQEKRLCNLGTLLPKLIIQSKANSMPFAFFDCVENEKETSNSSPPIIDHIAFVIV